MIDSIITFVLVVSAYIAGKWVGEADAYVEGFNQGVKLHKEQNNND